MAVTVDAIASASARPIDPQDHPEGRPAVSGAAASDLESRREADRARPDLAATATVTYAEEDHGVTEIRIDVPIFRDEAGGFFLLDPQGGRVALSARTTEAAQAEAAQLIAADGAGTAFRVQDHHVSTRRTHELLASGGGNYLLPLGRETKEDGAAYYLALGQANALLSERGDYSLGAPTFKDSHKVIPEDASPAFREGFREAQARDRRGFWTLTFPNSVIGYAGALQVPLFVRQGRGWVLSPRQATPGTPRQAPASDRTATTIDLVPRTTASGETVYVPSQISRGMGLAVARGRAAQAGAGRAGTGRPPGGAAAATPPRPLQAPGRTDGKPAAPAPRGVGAAAPDALAAQAVARLTPDQQKLVAPVLAGRLAAMPESARVSYLQSLAADADAYSALLAEVSQQEAGRALSADSAFGGAGIRLFDAGDRASAVAAALEQNRAASLDDAGAIHALLLRVETPTGEVLALVSGSVADLIRAAQSDLVMGEGRSVFYDPALAREAGRTLEGLVSAYSRGPGRPVGHQPISSTGAQPESRAQGSVESRRDAPDIAATARQPGAEPPTGSYAYDSPALRWMESAALSGGQRTALQSLQRRLDIRSPAAMDRIAALVGSGEITLAEAEAALTAFAQTGDLTAGDRSLAPSRDVAGQALDPQAPVLPEGVTITAVDAGSASGAVPDALNAARAHNSRAREGGYVLVVPRRDLSFVRFDNLTLLQAIELSDRAASEFPGLTPQDILVGGNGIVPPSLDGTRFGRQSERTVTAPQTVQIGPPDATLPPENGPPAWLQDEAKALTPDRIDATIGLLEAQGGFRQQLASEVRGQVALIADGRINEALYRRNPQFFHDRHATHTLDRKATQSLAALEGYRPESGGRVGRGNLVDAGERLVTLFRDPGLLGSQAQNRFGQWRSDARGAYPQNTTVIGTYLEGEDGTRFDGPYRAFHDAIVAHADAYTVVERAPDGWQEVTFATPQDRRAAVGAVLDGTDRSRGIRQTSGADNAWIYTWGPLTRGDDLRLGRITEWHAPLAAEAFIGIPPDVTDAVTAANLKTVQDLVDFGGATYANGAAENAVVALLAANARALLMGSDRSQASNTITNAVVLAAARQVVLGNPQTPQGGYFDLNNPPLTMPPLAALRAQLRATPVLDATSGSTGAYSDEAKAAAIDRVARDLAAANPALYRTLFGDAPPPDPPTGPATHDGPPPPGDDGAAPAGDAGGGPGPVTPAPDATRGQQAAPQASDTGLQRADSLRALARLGLDASVLGPAARADTAALAASVSAMAAFSDRSGDRLAAAFVLRRVNALPAAGGNTAGLPPELLRVLGDAGALSNAELLVRADGWLRSEYGIGATDVMPVYGWTDGDAFLSRVARLAALAGRVPQILGWVEPIAYDATLDEALPNDRTLRARAESVMGPLEDVDDGPVTLDLVLAIDQYLQASEGSSVTAADPLVDRPAVSVLLQRALGVRPTVVMGQRTDEAETLGTGAFADADGRRVQLDYVRLDPAEITAGRIAAELAGREATEMDEVVIALLLERGEISASEGVAASGLGHGHSGQRTAQFAERLEALVEAGIARRVSTSSLTRYTLTSLNADVPDLPRSARVALAVMAIAPRGQPISIRKVSLAMGRVPGNTGALTDLAQQQGLIRQGQGGWISAVRPMEPERALATTVSGRPVPFASIDVAPIYLTERDQSPNNAAIVRALHRGGELTRREISESAGVSAGTLTADLDRLARRGIVRVLGDAPQNTRGETTYALAANLDLDPSIDLSLARDAREVLGFIAENGPVRTSELRRAYAGRSSAEPLQRHLNQLRDAGAIARDGFDGWRATAVAPTRQRETGLSETDRRILTALEGGAMTRAALAEAIPGADGRIDMISYHLDKLEAAGIVGRSETGRAFFLVNQDQVLQLTDSQRGVLDHVGESGSTTVAEAARQTDLTPTQVRLIFDQLEARGLVERHGAGRALYFVPAGALAVPPAQIAVLRALGGDRLTVAQIVERTGSSPKQTRSTIDRMLADGLIDERQDGRSRTYGRVATD